MKITLQHILAWIDALQEVYAENKTFLTDLDSAIGDADHGVNMDRGFTAVKNELPAANSATISDALKTVSTILIRTVGGASGPLYGTFFLKASAACKGKAELDENDVLGIFQAGLEGVAQRGKAILNDKTMLDALTPAVEAMKQALGSGADMRNMLKQAADAAEKGMQATIPMLAKKGRASYLGERSIGHQDPGATSSYLMLKKAAEVWS